MYFALWILRLSSLQNPLKALMICDHESFFDPLNSDFSLNEQNDFLSTDGLGETPSGGVPKIPDSGSRGIHLKGTEECLKDEHCQKVGNKEDLLPNKRKLWIQRKDTCNLHNFLFYECIV